MSNSVGEKRNKRRERAVRVALALVLVALLIPLVVLPSWAHFSESVVSFDAQGFRTEDGRVSAYNQYDDGYGTPTPAPVPSTPQWGLLAMAAIFAVVIALRVRSEGKSEVPHDAAQ